MERQVNVMLLTPQHPLILFSREFSELCKPLELLHIQHFTYQKQFNDGTRISLSNKPQWIEDYYNLNLYESSLFEEKPSNYKASFQVWTGEYDLEVYRHGRTYYNTADSISITEPHPDGCEHYLFSATPDKSEAIQYLANNMNILYHFILFLKDKGITVFKKVQKSRIKVQEAFTETNRTKSTPNTNNFYEKMQIAKALFLNKTPISRYAIESGDSNGIKITQREIGCIIHLLQDKTAKETAQLLNLSHRTVESYIDNIKIKLNCDNKVELVRKLKQDKFLASLRG
jgi:DNA-binding CsgD family transcriptional regulator